MIDLTEFPLPLPNSTPHNQFHFSSCRRFKVLDYNSIQQTFFIRARFGSSPDLTIVEICHADIYGADPDLFEIIPATLLLVWYPSIRDCCNCRNHCPGCASQVHIPAGKRENRSTVIFMGIAGPWYGDRSARVIGNIVRNRQRILVAIRRTISH